MCKNSIGIIVVLAVLAFTPSDAFAIDWTMHTIQKVTDANALWRPQIVKRIGLALTPNDLPAIAHTDEDFGTDLYYSWMDNNKAFHTETVLQGVGENTIHYIDISFITGVSLAFDSTGGAGLALGFSGTTLVGSVNAIVYFYRQASAAIYPDETWLDIAADENDDRVVVELAYVHYPNFFFLNCPLPELKFNQNDVPILAFWESWTNSSNDAVAHAGWTFRWNGEWVDAMILGEANTPGGIQLQIADSVPDSELPYKIVYSTYDNGLVLRIANVGIGYPQATTSFPIGVTQGILYNGDFSLSIDSKKHIPSLAYVFGKHVFVTKATNTHGSAWGTPVRITNATGLPYYDNVTLGSLVLSTQGNPRVSLLLHGAENDPNWKGTLALLQGPSWPSVYSDWHVINTSTGHRDCWRPMMVRQKSNNIAYIATQNRTLVIDELTTYYQSQLATGDIGCSGNGTKRTNGLAGDILVMGGVAILLALPARKRFKSRAQQ